MAIMSWELSIYDREKFVNQYLKPLQDNLNTANTDNTIKNISLIQQANYLYFFQSIKKNQKDFVQGLEKHRVASNSNIRNHHMIKRDIEVTIDAVLASINKILPNATHDDLKLDLPVENQIPYVNLFALNQNIYETNGYNFGLDLFEHNFGIMHDCIHLMETNGKTKDIQLWLPIIKSVVKHYEILYRNVFDDYKKNKIGVPNKNWIKTLVKHDFIDDDQAQYLLRLTTKK